MNERRLEALTYRQLSVSDGTHSIRLRGELSKCNPCYAHQRFGLTPKIIDEWLIALQQMAFYDISFGFFDFNARAFSLEKINIWGFVESKSVCAKVDKTEVTVGFIFFLSLKFSFRFQMEWVDFDNQFLELNDRLIIDQSSMRSNEKGNELKSDKTFLDESIVNCHAVIVIVVIDTNTKSD